MSLGGNIQYSRRYYGWTQKDLAEKVGKAESSIRKYEADAINIPLSVVDDLANAFNVSREDLLGDIDNLRHSFAVKDFKDTSIKKNDKINMSNYWKYNTEFSKFIKFINSQNKSCGNPYIDFKNEDLWKEYNRKDVSIDAEDEYDIDLDEILENSKISEAKTIPYNPTARGWIETPKEINPKVLHEALDTLLIYVNKCSVPKLTDSQFDMIFDKVMDYIKFQLYQIDRE